MTVAAAQRAGISRANDVPSISHWEPTPNVRLVPMSVIRVFASAPTSQAAFPVVSCAS